MLHLLAFILCILGQSSGILSSSFTGLVLGPLVSWTELPYVSYTATAITDNLAIRCPIDWSTYCGKLVAGAVHSLLKWPTATHFPHTCLPSGAHFHTLLGRPCHFGRCLGLSLSHPCWVGVSGEFFTATAPIHPSIICSNQSVYYPPLLTVPVSQPLLGSIPPGEIGR